MPEADDPAATSTPTRRLPFDEVEAAALGSDPANVAKAYDADRADQVRSCLAARDWQVTALTMEGFTRHLPTPTGYVDEATQEIQDHPAIDPVWSNDNFRNDALTCWNSSTTDTPNPLETLDKAMAAATGTVSDAVERDPAYVRAQSDFENCLAGSSLTPAELSERETRIGEDAAAIQQKVSAGSLTPAAGVAALAPLGQQERALDDSVRPCRSAFERAEADAVSKAQSEYLIAHPDFPNEMARAVGPQVESLQDDEN